MGDLIANWIIEPGVASTTVVGNTAGIRVSGAGGNLAWVNKAIYNRHTIWAGS